MERAGRGELVEIKYIKSGRLIFFGDDILCIAKESSTIEKESRCHVRSEEAAYYGFI